MAEGLLPSIRDFVRDINDRKRSARVDDALRANYMDDPDAAVAEVFQIDPSTGMKLQEQQIARRTAADELRRKRTKDNTDTFARYLRGAKPGSDYGALVDQLTPFFKTSLGAGDDEIAAFRQAVAADPGILAGLDDEAFKDISKDRYSNTVLTPGAIALRGGEVTAKAPFAPRPVTLRSADGNSELHVFDPNAYTGDPVVQPQGMPSGVAPDAPAAAPPGGGVSDDEAGQILGDAMRSKVIGESNARVIRDSLGANGGAKYNQWLKENGIRVVPDAQAMAAPTGLPTERIQPQPERQMPPQTPVPPQARPQGPIARTTGVKPQKPVNRYRPATPEELRGYPPGTMAQINPETGEFKNLKTPPAATQTAQSPQKEQQRQAQVQSVIDQTSSLRRRAEALLNHPGGPGATGSIEGRAPGWMVGQQGEDFINDLTNIKDMTALNALKEMKMSSPNGASGLGSLTEKEATRLESLYGTLNRTSSWPTIQRTLREIISITTTAEQRARKLLAPAQPQGGQRGGQKRSPQLGQRIKDRATGRVAILDTSGWVWEDTGQPVGGRKK